ncbi:hypothetical protein BBJ28_00021890 [Nothophytophthora sp. Chile5]|nr:hypothetical protein BBJ28_00021890 [Nothophytophthora sp. Chile5]
MPVGTPPVHLASASSASSELRGQPLPPTLRYQEGKFRNSRDQELFYLAAFPELIETPGLRRRRQRGVRAVVLFLHALGDHSRRYSYLYEHLCEHGFGVIAYDFVSHGASDSCSHGLRAHAARFRYFVDDTNEFVTFAKNAIFPKMLQSTSSCSLPIVVGGYSYGTLVGIHTVLSRQHDFAGICFVGPSLWVRLTPMLKLQAAFARPLSKFFPKARIVPAINREWLCRDPGYFEDFENDPLTNSQLVTARMGSETLRAMQALAMDDSVSQRDSAFSQVAVLFLVGSEDRVVCREQGDRFFDRLGNHDKELKVFSGLYHCLLEDPERDDVLRHLTHWLEQRFPEGVK